MGAQKFNCHVAEGLNDQSVFFVAEFAFFHGLTKNAAVQLIIDATHAASRHVLLYDIAALLDFVHQAGKGGGAPNPALFQHADKGRLRIMRLKVAHVHAGLQFVVFDAGARGNGLKKGPVGRRRLVRLGFGHNQPTREVGAVHGMAVLPAFGRRDAGRQRFSPARRHAAFSRVPPNHAVHALLFCGHGVRHFKTMQRRDVHRLVGFLRLYFPCIFLFIPCHIAFHDARFFLFHYHDAFFVNHHVGLGRVGIGSAPSFGNVSARMLQEGLRVRAAVGARVRDVPSLVQVLARQHGVGGRKAEFVAGLLLQRARGERQRRGLDKFAHVGRANDVLKRGGRVQKCGASFCSVVPLVEVVL